jgi:hypothetical protein
MTSCLLTGKLLSRSRALDASTADRTLLPLAATLADRSVAVLEIGPLVTFELLNLFRGHPHPRDKQVSDYAKRSCQGGSVPANLHGAISEPASSRRWVYRGCAAIVLR